MFEYQVDLDQVIQNALIHQVKRIIVPAINLESSLAIIDLCEKYAPVYGAVGIHPEECATYNSSHRLQINHLLNHPKVVAVGEVGLDCFHRSDNIETQIKVFHTMLEIAAECKKPVIIHSRDCLRLVINTVKEVLQDFRIGKYNGVFHSFEGNWVDSEEVNELGFVIGAGGPITYKNASKKHELFSKIDLNNVVLETDGPFLSPQSHRGKRNEPAFIPEIAARLSELQKCDISEVSITTTKTAHALFIMD